MSAQQAQPLWLMRALERIADSSAGMKVGSDIHLLEMALKDRAELLEHALRDTVGALILPDLFPA